MNEQLETKIDVLPEKPTLNQVCEYFDAHPERMTQEYLNNFHLLAPGSKVRELFAENPKALDSKKKIYADFESAIGKAGVDLEQVKELSRALGEISGKNVFSKEPGEKFDQAAFFKNIGEYETMVKEIRTLLVPVYKEMRKMGYSTYELIA